MVTPKEFNGARFINEPLKYIEIKDHSVKNEPQADLNDYVIQEEEGFHKGYVEITIPTDSYIGQFLDRLPYGIINKTETGIGGTTLEIKAPRHSIIVEPTRAIAATKASPGILYVGSDYGRYQNKYRNKDWLKALELYTTDEKLLYKKIIVVADSLPKVIQALGDGIKDFFLLIDEIDVFQESGFRPNLEKCIDYYITHPFEQRALISATIRDFSHPELKLEHFITFKYPTPVNKNINLIHTNNVKKATSIKIQEIYTNINSSNKDETIIIAYNSITDILSIVDDLIGSGIEKNDIGILCGTSSAEEVDGYYQELNDMPKPITFKTSAYFSGVDFNFKYHLISVSNTNRNFTMLSPEKMKQISGRCRIKNGILSENIIYNLKYIEDAVINQEYECYLGQAQNEVDAALCFKKHIYPIMSSDGEYQKLQQELIRIINGTEKGFIREDIYGNPAVSYFKLDMFMEDIKIIARNYFSVQGLPRQLALMGNNVDFSESIYDDEDIIPNSQNHIQNKAKQQLKAIRILREYENPSEINLSKLLYENQTSKFTKKVLEQYYQLMGIVEHNDLISKLETFIKKRDDREYQAFVDKINKYISKEPVKIAIIECFNIGEVNSPEEIKLKLNKILAENHHTQLDDDSSVKFLKKFFDLKRTSKNYYKILNVFQPDVKIIF